MIKKITLLMIGLGLMLGNLIARETGEAKTAPVQRPTIEVTFVLDTTGSMGGLIEGAKLKIWSIVNEIMKAKPTPELRIGLVGYRDKKDAYVTRSFSISDNIDEVYKNLMSFKADGGGDTPEHVNQALHDALHKMNWSRNDRAFKVIYLVGDAPPHMDYNDGLDYRTIVEEIVKQNIIVNTVRCGKIPQTPKFWQDIARRGEGKYVSIAQSGGMTVIDTPMDKKLAELGKSLGKTVIAFGADGRRNKKLMRESEDLSHTKAPAAAERALYLSGKTKADHGGMDSWDLINAIKNNKLKLEDIDNKDLPEKMQTMTREEQRAYIEQKKQERETLNQQIGELNRQRADYIKQQIKQQGLTNENSFDAFVIDSLKEQAAKQGFTFEEPEDK